MHLVLGEIAAQIDPGVGEVVPSSAGPFGGAVFEKATAENGRDKQDRASG